MKIPRHVAIILDGNGRWAKEKGMPRTYGHTVGAKNVETICRDAWDLGIQYITMYAFSTENWKRPESEVATLMKLLDSYIKTCMKTAKKDNLRVRFIGDLSMLDKNLQSSIDKLVEFSKDHTGLTLTIAINYGGRDEIRRAVCDIANEVKEGIINPDDITEDTISKHLDTKEIPDPDLMIRTSGEQRLSNYLMWQLAYSEFYFTSVPWPAFSKKDLEDAIAAYNNRDRRYGAISEE